MITFYPIDSKLLNLVEEILMVMAHFRSILVVFGTLMSFVTWAKVFPQYPKDLSAPLEIPLNLAGSFGELRKNHYHAGWDLKTDERIGLKVLSIADGEIVRVKVSPEGYGCAIYVAHDQWQITSVYAHLSEFKSEVAQWVRNQQYQLKQFAVDLVPPKGMFTVKRQEVLGLSGNSGSSAGPHLHFEIRNAITEHPIDPHLLGYQLADITRPVIQRMWLIPQEKGETPLSLDFNFGGEAFGKDSLYEVSAVFGVGIEVYDYVLSADNQCGIQHMITLLDGNIISEWQIDSIDFARTHHVNSHLWRHPKLKGTQFHRGYLPAGAPEDHFLYTDKRGIVSIKDTLVHAITVMVTDFTGNATCVYAYVQNREEVKHQQSNGTVVNWDKGDTLSGRKVDIRIPAGALYENSVVEWEEGQALFRGDSVYFAGWTSQDVIWADKPTWHLHTTEGLKEKMGWYHEVTGDWKKIDSMGNARIKWPGRNYLVVDTLPPVVTKKDNASLPKEFSRQYSAFYAAINDELSGINRVEAWVEGQWVLLGLDAKNKLIYLDPQYVFNKPSFQLEVIAEDQMGNRSITVFEVAQPTLKKSPK